MLRVFCGVSLNPLEPGKSSDSPDMTKWNMAVDTAMSEVQNQGVIARLQECFEEVLRTAVVKDGELRFDSSVWADWAFASEGSDWSKKAARFIMFFSAVNQAVKTAGGLLKDLSAGEYLVHGRWYLSKGDPKFAVPLGYH